MPRTLDKSQFKKEFERTSFFWVDELNLADDPNAGTQIN